MAFARKSGRPVPGGNEAKTVQQGEPATKLTDYFELNKRDEFANHIIYPDLQYYTWNQKTKQWQRHHCGNHDKHQQYMSNSLGRIPTISLGPHQVRIILPTNASSSQKLGQLFMQSYGLSMVMSVQPSRQLAFKWNSN